MNEFDVSQTNTIPEKGIRFFQQNGYLIVRNLIDEEELSMLREQTAECIANAQQIAAVDPFRADYWFERKFDENNIEQTPVPYRVEYPCDKMSSAAKLLAHSRLLRIVRALQNNEPFIPTYDSLVFKLPKRCASIKWHRDASAKFVTSAPIIDCGVYLDDSPIDSCLHVIPGTHRFDDTMASAMIEHLNNSDGRFAQSTSAVAVPARAGDCVIHNILLLHGSPGGESSALRRTVYFEFRPIATEIAVGPHVVEYVRWKQIMLSQCIDMRQDEQPFDYDAAVEDEKLKSLRFAHDDFWRDADVATQPI